MYEAAEDYSSAADFLVKIFPIQLIKDRIV